MLEEFLAREARAGRFAPAWKPASRAMRVHGHCHQKAFGIVAPVLEVLRLIPGAAPELIESSCCGMAGSFGYEAEHHAVSMQMAELSLLPAVRSAPDAIIVADGTSCRHQIADGARPRSAARRAGAGRSPGLAQPTANAPLTPGAYVVSAMAASEAVLTIRSALPAVDKRKTMKRLLLATTATLVATTAFAEYPEKPITIVVPFAAGGPTDKVARDLAEALRKPLNNQTIVIENVGGAGGTLGATKVARASNDGYTLLLHHIGMATSPALYRNLPYKTLDDFEYVGMVNEVPMTLIGKPSLPANTYPELLKWLDANKGKINLANAGLGAASHLCGLLFQSSLKIDMQTVPYKGTGPAMTDLLGGQVDLMCDQTTNTTGQIEAGKVKAYAVTTTHRLTTPALAKLPTLDESGLKGFNVSIWHGLYAPKGTPKAALDKINAALKVALKDPDFVKREEALGAVIVTDGRVNGPEHKKFVESEIAKWGPAIKAAGQYAD